MNPPYATASLYVGDLEPNCTESMLFETFKKVGTVSSIRVCRDATTRQSLGYAYVNFHNAADAERAIDTLNYTPIGGGPKPCRIMWSHRDPSIRRSGAGNLFIKNLDASIDHKALCDTFSAFGNILSCKVALDKQGKSKGFGFVHYENPEAAQAAIDQVNGMLLCGKKVYVGLFVPRKQRGNSPGDVKYTNVFVKEIPASWDEEKFKTTCEEFGAITSIKLMTDAEGKSRCFGFVNFEKFDEAAAAVEKLNGMEVGEEKKLFAARAQKKEDREAELRRRFEEKKNKYAQSNLYIKNLDESVDVEKLRQIFSAYGEIISAKIMSDAQGVSKGFGFVCFSTPEEAHKAIMEKNNSMLEGKPLYVAMAQRKEVRSAQLSAQHAHRAGGRGMGMPNPMYGAGFQMMPQQRFNAYPPQMGLRPPRGQWQGRPGPNFGGMPQAQGYKGRNPRNGVPRNNNNNNNNAGPRGSGGNNAQGYVIQNNAKNAQGLPAQIPVEQATGDQTNAQGPNQSLADLSEKDRKHVLGEFLYPKIEELLSGQVEGEASETGKITGMLLESLDHGELVHLLESPSELKSRVEEAINVLREHLAQSNQKE